MGRIIATSLVSLALPLLLVAQSRGGAASASAGGHASVGAPHVSAPHVSAAPRVSAPQASARSTVRLGSPMVTRRGGRPIRRANGIPFNSGQIDFQDVPGLGFDFAHLAAISGNRRGRGHRFNGGFPFGFSGFLLSPPVIVEDAASSEPQPLAEDETSAEIASVDPERPSRSRPRAATPPESLAPPAPQPDAEQYVFIRRDGSLLFAVAYSWDNGTLRYVTPEGFRRAIPFDSLDLAATQQFNEQRGLTFRSPA
jgi:hypothetical protein